MSVMDNGTFSARSDMATVVGRQGARSSTFWMPRANESGRGKGSEGAEVQLNPPGRTAATLRSVTRSHGHTEKGHETAADLYG